MVRRKAVVAEPPKQQLTLRERLDEIEHPRWSRCHHDDEIRSDIMSEVKSALRDFGLLDAVRVDDGIVDGACSFCGSKEHTLMHREWCIRD